MAWRRSSDKPISEPVMVDLHMHMPQLGGNDRSVRVFFLQHRGSRINDAVRTRAQQGFWSYHSPCFRGCWTNNNDRSARPLFVQYPRERGEWLLQNPCLNTKYLNKIGKKKYHRRGGGGGGDNDNGNWCKLSVEPGKYLSSHVFLCWTDYFCVEPGFLCLTNVIIGK